MGIFILSAVNPEVAIWLAVIVLCVIIEFATVGLASIWFAAGGVVGLLCAMLRLPVVIQGIAFVGSSIGLLVLTRPILVNMLHIGDKKTNVDSLVGKYGIVTKEITEFAYGQVKVEGQVWTATTEDGETIAEGKRIRIERIDGVKLVVEPDYE